MVTSAAAPAPTRSSAVTLEATAPSRPPASIHHVLSHQHRPLSFWETDAFVTFITLFIWPVGLLLVTGFGMVSAHMMGALRASMQFLRLRRRRPRQPCHCDDEAAAAVLETGLYWYGRHNVCEREEGGDQPSKYFDPSRPSVIYVHGFQPYTIERRFRESLNWKLNDLDYGLDINAADHWIEAGWNVGVFYWNQFADEAFCHAAEAKIWTNKSSVRMRYRKVLTTSTSDDDDTALPRRTAYCYVDSSVPCVSEQLAQALQNRFTGATAPFRLVGHSLGSQLVIHTSTLLAQRAEEDPTIRLPTRLALLDPFFTPDPKSWLGWRTIASVLYDEIRDLSTTHHIVLEQYQTSIIGNPASLLGSVTAFFHLNPPHIPWYRLRSRHVAAPYLYFLSFADELASPIKDLAYNPILETTSRLYDLDDVVPQHHYYRSGSADGNQGGRSGGSSDDLRALAKAPDEALRLLMHATAWDELWGIFGVALDQ